MVQVHIRIADNQDLFYVGDTIKGTAEVTIPESVPISNISLSFHCLGEIKWHEYYGTTRYLTEKDFYDQYEYLEANLPVLESDVIVKPHRDHKTVFIPFSYTILDDNLPSTMVSNHGFIQYFVRASIKLDNDEVKKFIKEVTVHSPMNKDLMITVGASAEKTVLLHAGKVSMHASIGRKGFAPGETITVHITVNNKTNTKVVPKICLSQVQIYMCGNYHKTIECTLNDDQWVIGSEIEAHTEVEEVLDVTIPADEAMSIKSSLITVKYFVQVILDIPHSFDLHLNLPVVVTARKVIDQLQARKNVLVIVD